MLLAACYILLYRDVMLKLIQDWTYDENYSHGFLIVPLALYFAWEQRHRLRMEEPRPSNLGLGWILLSMAMLLAGTLGAELFTTRLAMLVTIAGTILFLWGWKHLRILLFPVSFLLLMIPIPAILINQITLPLQLLASRFGEFALHMLQIPVIREGNVIILASTSLEVAEACSGIRFLVSLMTLGIVYGYFFDSRWWLRLVLLSSTLPFAIASNGTRIAGTGWAAHYYGPEAAAGFFHLFAGWMVFLVAFAMIFLLSKVLRKTVPAAANLPPAESAE